MIDEAPAHPAIAHPVTAALEGVLASVRSDDPPGRLADYIPELANADARLFGISATAVSGHRYGAGDARHLFTIQSISKPFVYALALQTLGRDAVHDHVGVEPSGEPFNAISFDARGRPANPMINAGAIVTTSLIAGRDGDERFEIVRAGLSAFAGRDLVVDETVYRSESATGDRNRGLAHLARSNGMLGAAASGTGSAAGATVAGGAPDVSAVVEPYFRQCSLLVDTTDLAMMAATLANGGVHPLTGVEVVGGAVARDVLSVMAGCGMYDRSGDWLVRVGMPAKSGVGGGIVAVTPGQYGIGVFSAPLDAAGNSSRGVAALRRLSSEFELHMLDHPRDPASVVERVDVDAASATISVRLRGELDFVAAEHTVFETRAAAESLGYTAGATVDGLPGAGSSHSNGIVSGTGTGTLIVDLASVTRTTAVAARLLLAIAADLERRGFTVTLIDPDGVLSR